LVTAENSGGRTRYRLLETVRQYAQEKLGESGEAEAIRARHRDHYSTIAALLDAPARTDYGGRVQQADDEIDNLRSAFGWSIETGDIAKAVGLASSLQPLWLSRGRIQEGVAWFDAVVTDDNAPLIDAVPEVRARALADKAVLDEYVGVYNVSDAEQALVLARELDDQALLVRALTACGSATVYDVDIAGPYFAEANVLAREVGDQWRLIQILTQQAQAAFVAGDPTGVRFAAEEGRDIANTIGDVFGSRQCRWRLAGALTFQGDLTGGIAQMRELVAEAEADHDVMLRVTVLLMLPHALAFQGDAAAAISAANSALESATDIGDLYVGSSHISSISAYLAAGDVQRASEAAETAWSHLSGFEELASINRIYIAEAALARGDFTDARRSADDSAATTKGWYRAAALAIRARIAIAESDTEQAARDCHEALTCSADVGAHLCMPGIFDLLASLAVEAGSHREAARLFGAAEHSRLQTGMVRYPIYQAAYDSSLHELKNALSEEDFEAAWAEGMALSTDEAIAYAQRGRGERKRPSSGWASLTPAELDVVRLVSEGLGNKDVAARLFVSPRTVQSHLTRVYTKLELSSRVQLAQEAARRSTATND
jgi:DNA-binding CsgD family transcriptional regulator